MGKSIHGKNMRKPPIDGFEPKEKERFKNMFENACELQLTEEEICTLLGVSVKSIYSWCKRVYDGKTFAEIYPKLRMGGKQSFRRQQLELAKSNATMNIWLDKTWYGAHEENTICVNFEDLTPLAKMLSIDTETDENGADGATAETEAETADPMNTPEE